MSAPVGDRGTRGAAYGAVCGLFFLSGAAALVYQVLWLRGFSIVFGSTVYSMSCVLAAFMAGLALGAAIATRALRARPSLRRATLLRIYGVLELTIGLSGLALTLALFTGQQYWLAAFGSFGSASTLVTLSVHFFVSFAVLIIPTSCMGATLPILVTGLEDDLDTASLYGFNTFGAAAGSLGAGFVLIYLFGVVATTLIVSLAAVLLFVAALWIARVLDRRRASSERSGAIVRQRRQAESGWSPAVLVMLAFASGFQFFSLELVWNRLLSVVLGNRVYVTSITIATVLACLGVGAMVSRFVARRVTPAAGLAASYAVAALSLCAGLLAQPNALQTDDEYLLVFFLIVTIPLPAIALGIAFPLLLAMPAPGAHRGVHVGRMYAVNTLGAMAGSLLTSYVFFSAFGSNRILILGIAILAVSVVLLTLRVENRRGARVSVAAVMLALCVAVAFRWNSKLSIVPEADALVVEEDAYGVFSITQEDDGYLSVRSNRTELVFLFGHPLTQYVQEASAHLPLLFAKNRERVAVIGSGYGITAGAASQWSDVHVVDAVEILPLMVEHADRFRSGNYDYSRDPKVAVHVTDGRMFLATSRVRYDVISINMSDPYLPGASSLFSEEFYAMVTRALEPSGVVCQHLFGPDLASLYHGFKKHFRYVTVIPSYENGALVLGSQEPLEPDAREMFRGERSREILARIGFTSEQDLADVFLEGARIEQRLESSPALFLNSDLNPALEFRRSPEVDTLFSNF